MHIYDIRFYPTYGDDEYPTLRVEILASSEEEAMDIVNWSYYEILREQGFGDRCSRSQFRLELMVPNVQSSSGVETKEEWQTIRSALARLGLSQKAVKHIP